MNNNDNDFNFDNMTLHTQVRIVIDYNSHLAITYWRKCLTEHLLADCWSTGTDFAVFSDSFHTSWWQKMVPSDKSQIRTQSEISLLTRSVASLACTLLPTLHTHKGHQEMKSKYEVIYLVTWNIRPKVPLLMQSSHKAGKFIFKLIFSLT